LSEIKRLVESAAKFDVDIMIPIENTLKEDFDPSKIASELEYYKNSENVLGFNLLDEPGRISFDALAKIAQKLRPYIGDKLLYVNHMPMYATAGQLNGGWWSPYEEEANSDDYYDFFQSFYEKVKEVGLASYDFYPFRHEKGCCDPRYFEQMCIAKKISEAYDLALWNFTQVTSWNRDAVRNMTYSEMAWLNNTSIACGVTGLQYFCYWTPSDGVETFENAMISRDGNRTKHYYFAQDLNAKIDKIAPYILDAKFVGTIPYGDTICAFPPKYALRTFGKLDRFMCDGMLIGCFEWQGKNMYFVVNTSVMETRLTELTFKEEIKAKVIIGLNEFVFSGQVLNKPLGAGEAMLVVEE
ncbi:MAG: beta-galactosidase, partial [Clostridia bacterium]|nr:beta-galactosidase [Clostridia bacterium]